MLTAVISPLKHHQLLIYSLRIAACVFLAIGSAHAEDDVDDRDLTGTIDQMLSDSWTAAGVTPAETCSDSVFVRRSYLDLVGRIPTVQEAETFLQDGRSDKRAQLIQVLTTSEDYAQHFADMFDALLMGRTSQRNYDERSKHQWRSYLERVFRENQSWNDVVAEILLARPASNDDRGAVWFLFERKEKHQEIAEAVAPAFFGIRIDCAQCHDHMSAHEIEQAHYWGLVAFFNRSKNVHTKNGPRISEDAIGGFSEFANLEGDSSPNLLTFFKSVTIAEERPDKDAKPEDKDDLYVPAGLDGDPRVPRFSRREKFVDEIVSDHPLIARAFVNRIWAMLMGRGIVHPFDEMDSVHPPSHPELLDLLAEDFRKSDYNIRRLVQTIASTKAYQLGSVKPQGIDDPATFAWYLERPLTAEQIGRSMQLGVRGNFDNNSQSVQQVRQSIRDVMPKENVATVKDALFLTNNAAVNNFINESNDKNHLTLRTLNLGSPQQQAELLFQTIFGRQPDSEEVEAVASYLMQNQASQMDRIKQVIWSLITSAEFRFNH